jgi:hypothetical protein
MLTGNSIFYLFAGTLPHFEVKFRFVFLRAKVDLVVKNGKNSVGKEKKAKRGFSCAQ